MITCNKCNFEIQNHNYNKHINSCNGLGPRRKRDKIGKRGGWNKGKETPINVKEKIANSLIGKSLGISSTHEKEIERRIKISNTSKKNKKSGGLREGSGRGIKTWYNSKIAGNVYLRSTYELKYAKWLDKNNIKWKLNSKSFDYEYDNIKRKYYPDFYLIDQKCYIEIKGFKTKQDEAKWKYFPHELKVLYKNDIEKLMEGC